MTASRSDPLENVLDTAIEKSEGQDKVTIGEVLEMFGDRSFGPVMVMMGLLTVIPPLGAIPGLPVVVGLVIILFAVQILAGMTHIWLPGFVSDMSIEREKLKAASEKAKPWLSRIDRLVTERLSWATTKPAVYISAVCVCFLSLLMIPLEPVPFAVAAPGAAIVFFGLAIVSRDGVLMLSAFAATAASLALAALAVPWGKFGAMFS